MVYTLHKVHSGSAEAAHDAHNMHRMQRVHKEHMYSDKISSQTCSCLTGAYSNWAHFTVQQWHACDGVVVVAAPQLFAAQHAQ
jgi:hypothetical protein